MKSFCFYAQDAGEFTWSPAIQSAILSSFYWCYILSQMLGGVLTQYFGTKTIFGGSQAVTAICSLLIPSAAEIHYGAMIALRSIQGIASVSLRNYKFNLIFRQYKNLKDLKAAEGSQFMSSKSS